MTTRETLTVYAIDANGSRFRVAGYPRETALKVVNDETVRHICHAVELIAVNKAGDVVARTQTAPDPPPLRVCERCLMAIESREGSQPVKRIYIDDDEPAPICEWCEEPAFALLYELL